MGLMVSEKKKILFIIWSYTYGGGAEALLTMIVNHLNPEKYDISIIEYEHAGCKTERVKNHIHILPPMERVETPEPRKKGYQAYHTPEVLTEKYIGRDYDLYVSFNYQIPTFLLPEGMKNIAWIHGDVYDLALESARRERELQDRAFDKVKKIVAISDHTEKSLRELFPRHREKIVKIYNGIDLEDVRRRSGEESEETLQGLPLISVARLDENKNPIRLLGIFEKVCRFKPEARLYYMGEGKLRRALEEEIERLGLGEQVRLLGYVSNPYPIMRQGAVFCLMSEAEGLPMSVMEALALGVPFVSTDVGGCAMLADGQRCGRVVHTDEEAIGAVLELLDGSREIWKDSCRKSVERFGMDKYMAQIEGLFDSVMEDK